MPDRKLRESFTPAPAAVDRVVTAALHPKSRSPRRLDSRLVAAAALILFVAGLVIGLREDSTQQAAWELVSRGPEIELRKNGETVETTGPPGKILILTRPGGDA